MVQDGEVLVTGGAGYIGSHTVVSLVESGFDVVIVDALMNAVEEAVDRAKELLGEKSNKVSFYKVNICDSEELEKVFKQHKFSSCIHFAGLKAVGESVAKPLWYYNNNLTGTLILLELMGKYGCKNIVFSSSATVYGEPEKVPITEDFPLKATNPYGRTKLFIEEMMRDLYISDSDWNIVLLRYFNPVGAHESGRIGEDPVGIPNNLMPFVQQVAVGRRPELSVFGSDYNTVDGTGVRDYIHVVDLAEGHVAALKKLESTPRLGCIAYNLGTGRGTSVLEMVQAFEMASGKKIPYKLCPRRPGDCAIVYADPSFAEKELGWKAKRGIEEMCIDQWRWASNNPFGYKQ